MIVRKDRMPVEGVVLKKKRRLYRVFGLTIIDWLILKRYLSSFFFICLIFALIACVIDFSEKVEDFTKPNVPMSGIMSYFAHFVPHITAFLYPLFIFISTIFFTSKMAYKTEIIAILASGASFHRWMRPYFIGGLMTLGLSLWANHFAVPDSNKTRLHLEDLYVHRAITESDKNVHLQLSRNLLVYVEGYNYVTNSGTRFTAETIDTTALVEKVMADRISYDSVMQLWTLYTVAIRRNNGLKESIEFLPQAVRKYPFTPSDLRADHDVQTSMTTPELDRFIARQMLHGNENLNAIYVEKYRRTSQPFAGLILVIIGACMASKKVRGGSGYHIAIGIVLAAVYMMAMQFSQTFSIKAGLSPLLAVWIPNIAYSMYAAYLYWREVR